MYCMFDENEDLRVEFNYEEYGIIHKASTELQIPMYEVMHKMLEENLRVAGLFVAACNVKNRAKEKNQTAETDYDFSLNDDVLLVDGEMNDGNNYTTAY